MRLENDTDFNFLYNEECEKIPFLFKYNRTRFKVALIIMLVSFVAMLVLFTLFYNTQTTELMPAVIPQSTVGAYQYVSNYEYGYMVATLIAGLVVALMGVWITIAKLMDNRAFKKASRLSNMIFLNERHRMEVEWQNWKMNNRDY